MKKQISLIALGLMAAVPAIASQQSDSKGFIDDSHLDVLLRNAYINRDYQDGLEDKAEWGQGIITTFKSGFTEGVVGFGVDGIAQYAVRLDGGRGRSGAGGIDFFKQNDDGKAKSNLAKFGATAKMRFSNTVLSYGTQNPVLPILYADDSRLLQETYTGTLLTSQEIEGLDVSAGYFTDEQRKSDDRHNSGLKSMTFGGASYQFNDQFSGAFYASNVENVLNKQYLGLNFKQPFATGQQLVLDFNGYNSRLKRGYANELDTGRNNTIWSLAASYIWDIHTFKLAWQQNNGSTGYNYGGYRNRGGVGDGGNTIWLANSYWSDFNGEDERSWQASYGLDLGGLGLPGLSWTTAYVNGDNIKTSATSNGKEHEWFNQVQYQVQDGPAKDLKFKVRYSVLRVSNNASDYNSSGNEIRVFVDYPFNVF
ncbi:OprD family outer membrane porin [Pluralibacter gergoviae]|uniref:OprD family outer membrane porin n=1 Tax=Pluralibacter gergoviae TaxID=61647 RepID=UPI000A365A42|nr:OprD family outer membrane porin [Pluralibacter gergoviae]EKT9642579.1 OprD family outer membrane porin [Pluralibacter gergoviae]EKV3544844.1 OprD family outer membrane porin [Pluralibacter gergoviae]EKV9897399.1 OprD family outer membrane porin [Pluralibacter gergoviae]EKV9931272.1 OprD family outer membrane porin [Pluralibacter gergoviae]EKW9975511.1 OprD family outer membrane porin [Pluralibacter gergoviae]